MEDSAGKMANEKKKKNEVNIRQKQTERVKDALKPSNTNKTCRTVMQNFLEL